MMSWITSDMWIYIHYNPVKHGYVARVIDWRYSSKEPRDVLQQFKDKGWAQPPGSDYAPVPGNVMEWWPESLPSGFGYIGLVHQLSNGILCTIEGNKSPQVPGFSYAVWTSCWGLAMCLADEKFHGKSEIGGNEQWIATRQR